MERFSTTGRYQKFPQISVAQNNNKDIIFSMQSMFKTFANHGSAHKLGFII